MQAGGFSEVIRRGSTLQNPDQACFLVPMTSEWMALVGARLEDDDALFKLGFDSSCDVYDNEAAWWCPSSTTPSTGGSMAPLALWIRSLKARGSSTSQSRPIFEHFISMCRSNCSLVVDDQLQMMAFIVYTAGVLVVGYPGVCIHGVPLVLGRH